MRVCCSFNDLWLLRCDTGKGLKEPNFDSGVVWWIPCLKLEVQAPWTSSWWSFGSFTSSFVTSALRPCARTFLYLWLSIISAIKMVSDCYWRCRRRCLSSRTSTQSVKRWSTSRSTWSSMHPMFTSPWLPSSPGFLSYDLVSLLPTLYILYISLIHHFASSIFAWNYLNTPNIEMM